MKMRAGWLGRGGLVLGALVVLGALAAACGAPPRPEGPPQAAKAPPPASATAAPAPEPTAAPVATAARPPDIIIHEADVFGEIHARAGSTVQMLSLVATRTPPGPGVKAVLMRGIEEGGDTQWVAIADVTVKKELDAAGQMALTITDEKKDVLVGGRKVNHFVKGVRVKLHWEY